jgi:hypothetical protein
MRILVFAFTLASVGACGSRTELLVDGTGAGPAPAPDAGEPVVDAGHGPALDASLDRLEVVDALAPPPRGCDAGTSVIYVVTSQSVLMSFDPLSATFTRVGRVACPTSFGPNSMAVDHTGTAYMGFVDGSLFRVDTATAACQATGFVVGQQNYSPSFGMAFVSNPSGSVETLYVAESMSQGRLATIDTTTLTLSIVGTFDAVAPELTGTGAGELFGFYAEGADSAIGQIDRKTARIVSQSLVPVSQGPDYAFAFWGGDFYLFTAQSVASTVTRFRPSDGSTVVVAQAPLGPEPTAEIVGAGVSICAPR